MRFFTTKKENMNKHTSTTILSVLAALLLFGLYIVLTHYEKPVYQFYTLPTDKQLDSIEGRINF